MTLRALEWDAVWPRRLARVREWVVEHHPGTAAAPVPLAQDALAQLRARVAAASGDQAALESLAASLSPREVRALVTGIEQWEPLRRDVSVLLWRRSKAGLIAPLWNAWQRFPRVKEIRGILLGLTEQWGWSSVASEELTEHVGEWVRSEHPGLEMQRWLERAGLGYSDLAGLEGVWLLPQSPLDRLVREAVLTDGSEAQLKREGAARIAEWSLELAPELHLRFGQNLLTGWGVRPDVRLILDRIADRYGLPRRPTISRFWDPIDEETKLAFQRLFVQRRIRELFRSDLYRSEYWERWTEQLYDVQRGTVEGVEYGLLDFDSFGVVEFFETGNAAFFYSEERFRRVSARQIHNRKDLKDKYYPSFTPWQDNRLIHNPPPRGWYGRADRMVQRWIAMTKRT